jgi:CheY-like chemotaxis protein
MLSRSRTIRILGLAFALAAAPYLADLNGKILAQVPARDAFAREPKTPLETWEIASYLIRIGQPDQAAPYVKKFLADNPDDATLLEVRDTYGVGTVLGLSDYPETKAYAKPLAQRLAEASIRNATDPARMERFIANLSKTREEQRYAVERLRDAGAYAIPPMIRALSVSGLDPSVRTPLAENLGRLDRKAVPALIASLDSTDDALVGEVAHALGQIGDPRAIPALTYLAARPKPESAARPMVVQAIRELTGNPFSSQLRTPVRLLSDEARNYHIHAYKFPGDPIVFWQWDAAEKAPVHRSISVREAEGLLGLRAAKEALELDPTDVEAKVNLLSLGLDHDPAAWRAAALAAGPDVMGKVVRRAIADRRADLATTATSILGQLSSRDDLKVDRMTPLVDALYAPDRRVQFAAAEALVKLEPKVRFLGSSRVVPVLARFVTGLPSPRAVVIDGNGERASQVAGYLRGLGYNAHVASTGAQGFSEAVEAADVELITIDPNFIGDSWKLAEILGNLKADARTAGIPVFLVGPLFIQKQMGSSLESFPNVQFLVTPAETRLLKVQLDRGFDSLGVRPMSAAERIDYAKKASSLLAQAAGRPRSPFEGDLAAAEPALALALNGPSAPIEAASALGDVPGTDSQRTLADVMLDPSKEEPVRLASARRLTHNIRRFGPKLAAIQERRLVTELSQEADPALQEALAAVVGVLQPPPDASASKLQTFRASSP